MKKNVLFILCAWFSFSISAAPLFYESTMTGNETFSYPNEFMGIYELNPNGANRAFNSSGNFPLGFIALIHNRGDKYRIAFNGSDFVSAGEGSFFVFTGAGWSRMNPAQINPVAYPTGYYGVSGHNLAYLDQDNDFVANRMTINSKDPTTQAIYIKVAGVPWAGESVGFNYAGIKNGIPFNVNVTYTVLGGDTIAMVANGILAALKANSGLENILGPGYLYTACKITGDTIVFNQYWPVNLTATTTALSSAHTTVAILDQGRPQAEMAPYFSLARHIDGRIPLAHDIIGAYLFIGDDTAGPYAQQYGIIQCKIIDPNHADPRGEVDILTLQKDGLAVGRGVWTVGTGSALGGDLGYGKINAKGLYVDNQPVLVVRPVGPFEETSLDPGRFAVTAITDYNGEGFRLSRVGISWNISVDENGKLVFQYFNGTAWSNKLRIGLNGIEN